MINGTDINAPAAMRFFCPSQCGVSRHQSERGRPALLSRSRYPSAGSGRGAERDVRPDAPRSAAGLQIQKRLALELTDTCVEGHLSHETVAVGAPAALPHHRQYGSVYGG